MIRRRPVIGLDEQPTPLSGATRTPLPVQPGPAQRYDYAYVRIGTANNFMIVEPVAGWRQVSVRPTKTALDLAQEIKALLDVDYPRAEKVVLVWD
ncbi:MAG: IS630 family transposase, partial [Chromatiaceae bacterium]